VIGHYAHSLPASLQQRHSAVRDDFDFVIYLRGECCTELVPYFIDASDRIHCSSSAFDLGCDMGAR
jgi:hypothetical protein